MSKNHNYFEVYFIYIKDGVLIKAKNEIKDLELAKLSDLYEYYLMHYESIITPLECAVLEDGKYNYIAVLDGDLNGYTYLKSFDIHV